MNRRASFKAITQASTTATQIRAKATTTTTTTTKTASANVPVWLKFFNAKIIFILFP